MTATVESATGTRIVLGQNQYGKAEVRLVKITRDTDRHQIQDLNVTSQLRGDFEAAHTAGDNAHVVATDTQKNTVYALARDGVATTEEFLLRLGNHFTESFDWSPADAGRRSSTSGTASTTTTTPSPGTRAKSAPRCSRFPATRRPSWQASRTSLS